MNFLKRFETQLFLGWFLAVHIFELLLVPSLMVPTQLLAQYSLSQRFLQIWLTNADMQHYMVVARSGYSIESPVFFPLWPLVLKIFGVNPWAAKIIPCLLTFLFLLMLAKIISLWGYNKAKTAILWSFVAFPFSFMLLGPMAEPLFLVLSAGSILLAERKHFIPAAILAALASATRLNGILLTLYIALKLLSSGRVIVQKRWWIIPVSALGVVLYSLFLHIQYGDFTLFYKEEAKWGRGLGIESLAKFLQEMLFIGNQLIGSYKPVPINLIHWGGVFLFIFLAIYSFKKINLAAWIYSVSYVVLPLISGTFLSSPRYILAAFPLMIGLGVFLHKRPVLLYFYIGLSFMLQALLLIRFFNYEFVA